VCWQTARVVVKFDVGGIPSGSTVSSAALHLYVINTSTQNLEQLIYVHPVTNDRHEYVAGTDPADANDHLKLNITPSNADAVISFFTRTLDPQYYTESSRRYSLEETTDLLAGDWLGVAQYTNLIGTDAVQLYTNAAPSSARAFYRAITWVE
jgi:hypothetical protein